MKNDKMKESTSIMCMSVKISEAQEAYILRTRVAREWAGKSREETAKAIGVSLSTYGNYEVVARNRPMPQEYIAKFCEYLGINERWLISNKGNMEADYVEKLERLVKQHISSLQESLRS